MSHPLSLGVWTKNKSPSFSHRAICRMGVWLPGKKYNFLFFHILTSIRGMQKSTYWISNPEYVIILGHLRLHPRVPNGQYFITPLFNTMICDETHKDAPTRNKTLILSPVCCSLEHYRDVIRTSYILDSAASTYLRVRFDVNHCK